MFGNKLTNEMIFLSERSKKILKDIYRFHKGKNVYSYENIGKEDIKYLMAYLTELELIDERIEEINIKARKAQVITDLNFDALLYAKLLILQKKVKDAKKIENKFCKY